MDSWIRFAIFAVILFSFLRRIMKARTRSGGPSPTARGRSGSPAAPVGLPSNMQTEFPSALDGTFRSSKFPTEFPAKVPSTFPSTITPTMARPRSGRKNDFRDVPPPPENPDLG